MRISHKHKFIWISKPKTGSTSIRKLLDPHSDVHSGEKQPYYHHTTLLKLKEHFDTIDADFNSYFKICASRNPWEMLISLYCYNKADINAVNFWETNKKYTYQPDKLMSFEEWIERPFIRQTWGMYHKLENYIFDQAGHSLVDKVYSINAGAESIIEDLNSHCNLELDINDIPHVNKTEKSEDFLKIAHELMRNKSVNDSIQSIFAYEIDRFNYVNPFL